MSADTMTKDETIRLQAAEIERLRAEVDRLEKALLDAVTQIAQLRGEYE